MATLKVDRNRLPYLEDLALTLENESEFYRLYQQAVSSLKARDLIYVWNSKTLKQRGADEVGMSADEREFLRRYFNQKWDLSQPGRGSRDLCDGPGFFIFLQPAPKKPKPATPELATDWLSLPDGTTLITASGAKYTKGPGTIDQGCHPVSISSMKEQAAKGFVIGVSHKSRGSWNRWDKDGLSCSDTGKVYDTMTGHHHLVSYELPEKPAGIDLAKTPFKQIGPVDYSQLPDGTRLFTKGRGVYIKGRRPPSNVKGFPASLVGRDLGGRTARPVVGYQLNTDGSWAGWNSWYSDGSDDSDDSMYALTGYDATPSGGPMPATNQPQPTRDDQIDASLYIQPQPTKEDIMNATITITTKTLINGSDIANYSNAQLYEIIAAQEKKIAELDAIKNKPKALKKELADRQAGIDALVAHLDSRDDSAAK